MSSYFHLSKSKDQIIYILNNKSTYLTTVSSKRANTISALYNAYMYVTCTLFLIFQTIRVFIIKTRTKTSIQTHAIRRGKRERYVVKVTVFCQGSVNGDTKRGQKKRTQYIITRKCMSYRDTAYLKTYNSKIHIKIFL